MADVKMRMDPTDDGKNPYGVRCPTCGAKPGFRCTSRNWRNPTVYADPHVTRSQEAVSGIAFQIRRRQVAAAIERRRADLKDDQGGELE